MKKVFVSLFAMALMVSGSVLSAQETESVVEAKAAEAVEAAVVSSPAEEVAPVAVDAQGSVSDGVAVEAEAMIPMASPVAADFSYGSEVVLGGCASGCGQPIQAFVPAASCGSCCGQSSFIQPVVYNQPIQDVGSSIVSPAPVPATVYSQPATSGCSSCSGGGVVNYPAAVSYPAASTPVATSYAPVEASYAPVESSYAPVDSSYASAPVATSGCSSCGGGAVSYSSPSPCCSSSSNACCQSSGRGRSGLSSRFRRILIGRAIDESR